MAISQKLDNFLKDNRVSYSVVPHAKSYSAVETADAERVPLELIAKVVIVKASDNHMMVVIPGDCTLDLLKFEGVVGTSALKVDKEKDFKELFEDCEVGAMPAFGWLYGLPTFVDIRLTECPEIMMSSGDHEEGICMKMADYLRIAKAEVVDVVRG